MDDSKVPGCSRGAVIMRRLRIVTAVLTASLALGTAACSPAGTATTGAPSQQTPGGARTAAQGAVTSQTPESGPVVQVAAVGEMVEVYDNIRVGVSGGKLVNGGKSLALQCFADAPDTTEIISFTLEDSQGGSYTENYDVSDEYSSLMTTGEGLGWISFFDGGKPLASLKDVPLDGLALVIEVDSERDERVVLAKTRISLTGLDTLRADNAVTKAAAAASAAEAHRIDSSTVTMGEYKQVKRGMTLKQVRAIVGFAGKESARSGGFVIYDWANYDGSNVSVTFYGGRVRSKAQAGL